MSHSRIRYHRGVIAVFMLLLAPSVYGQVFDPGTSDSSLFDTVIDVPPSPNIGSGDIGGNGLTTQVNVADGGSISGSADVVAGTEVNLTGGSIGVFFDIENGGELNVSGGTIGLAPDALSGSFVTITGGNVGQSFDVRSGSTVMLSGGVVGQRFAADPGSDVTIEGSRFRLNGEPVIDPLNPLDPVFVDLLPGDIMIGALADGSAFIFAHEGLDRLNNARFVPVEPSTINTDPIVVDTPNPDRPSGLLEGQEMFLRDGGVLGDNFEIVGATLNIEGGFLGKALGVAGGELAASVVNMTGGSSDSNTEIYQGGIVNISGGSFGGFVEAFSGSELQISGGSLGSSCTAFDGSHVSISGGVVDCGFTALAGSTVDLTGGAVGLDFDVEPGSNVTINGGEFRLNGSDFAGMNITLSEGDIFTGTLADGSAFIFSELLFDEIVGLNLNEVPLPPLDKTPQIVDTVNPARPSGLRAGQTLTLLDGGQLPEHFEAVEATLNIEGGVLEREAHFLDSTVNMSAGEMERRFKMLGGELNINGGETGSQSTALEGCVVTLSGGSIGLEFFIENSVLNVSGGSIEDALTIAIGAVANITGGEITRTDFVAEFGSVMNIRGGQFPIGGGSLGGGFDGFSFESGSEVNITGSSFMLDGVLLDDGLMSEVPTAIAASGSLLTGILADGSAFSFDFANGDFISSEATLTLALPALLGDINRDGIVNLLDVSPFVDLISSGSFQAEADINGDGIVNLLDVGPFIQLLGGNS